MAYLFRWSNGTTDAETFQASDKSEFRKNARDAALMMVVRSGNPHRQLELHVHGHPRMGNSPWRSVLDSRGKMWVLLDLSKPLRSETLDRVWHDIEARVKWDNTLREFLGLAADWIDRELRDKP